MRAASLWAPVCYVSRVPAGAPWSGGSGGLRLAWEAGHSDGDGIPSRLHRPARQRRVNPVPVAGSGALVTLTMSLALVRNEYAYTTGTLRRAMGLSRRSAVK